MTKKKDSAFVSTNVEHLNNFSTKNINNFIDINEFCKCSNLKKSYVYHLTSKGKLKTYKPFGKKIYLKISEINELFEKSASCTQDEITSDAVNFVFNPKKK